MNSGIGMGSGRPIYIEHPIERPGWDTLHLQTIVNAQKCLR